MARVAILFVALAPLCRGWGPSPYLTSRRWGRALASQPVADSYPGWEAAMLEEHKKQCAASVFATVPAGAPTGGSKLGSGSAGGYSGGWVAMPVGADCVLALDNAPYLTLEGSPSKDLVHVSDQPLLTGDECDAIVKSAEKRAAEHGWGSRYTYQTSSHEVHVEDCPVAKVLLDKLLSSALLPAIHQAHPRFAAESLRVYQALVVKYDASSGRVGMPAHGDFGLLTLNIALNSQGDDYEGGGTWFQALGETVAPPKGHGVLHASPLVHAGAPTVHGARYQLVVFAVSAQWPDVGGRLQLAGTNMLGTGEAAGAVASLEHSVRANGMDPETWFQLGRARQASGDLAGAALALTTATQLGDASNNPSFDAHFALGGCLQALQQFEAAGAAFVQAADVGAPPGVGQATRELDCVHNYGLTLLALQKYDDAGLVFEQVITADPLAASAWASLGVCMHALDQPDAALACQTQVAALQKQAAEQKQGATLAV